MPDSVMEVKGLRMLRCDGSGLTLQSSTDADDLIGRAWGEQADLVVLPLDRLGAQMRDLSSRRFGEMAQKFVNYGLRLVFLGDVSVLLQSNAWRDFIRETNKGRSIWFLADDLELAKKLETLQG